MTISKTPKDITGWHAHVYYDEDTRETAAEVREALEANFDVELGRWRDKPVGPHPMCSYQVAFKPEDFSEVMSWLALNREDLIIFIHPNTGDDLIDHVEYDIWMGDKLDLNPEWIEKAASR